MISVSGLVRQYGAKAALNGIDLTVEPGERLAVLGHNGAGKTTLIRILAGLLKPTSGAVGVLGGTPTQPAVRARIGVLTHQPWLYPRLTALENLRFWGRIYGAPANGAAMLLERLGLDPADRRTVSAYSQGMRQRVGIARAVLHRPDVVLLDEPFGPLDPDGELAAASLLSEFTLVLATHQMAKTAGVTTRAITLEAGRLT